MTKPRCETCGRILPPLLRVSPSVVRRYEAGESSVALAVALGASPATVLRALRRAGARVRRPGPIRNEATRRTVLALRKKGLSYAKIGATVGLSRARIGQIVAEVKRS